MASLYWGVADYKWSEYLISKVSHQPLKSDVLLNVVRDRAIELGYGCDINVRCLHCVI